MVAGLKLCSIYLFLLFGTTKSRLLGKLGTTGKKRKEIEGFWFSLFEMKI